MASTEVRQEQGPLIHVCDDIMPLATLDDNLGEKERRGAPRRKLSIPVWVRVITGSGVSPAQARQLLDISSFGLGINSKVKYRCGQQMMVELCINNTTWSGPMRVVHCTEMAGGYKVGLTVVGDAAGVEAEGAEGNRGRRPSDAANLKRLQAEIPKAMRAYRQARASWGLLGTPVKNNIMRIIAGLPPQEDNYRGHSRRKHRRMRITGDVHLVVPTYYGGKWLRAQILDISEGGAGLSIPFNLTSDDIERELAGDFKIAPKVPVIIGIGAEPNTIWLPAEITRCGKPENGAVRVGIAFNTPAAQAAFGA